MWKFIIILNLLSVNLFSQIVKTCSTDLNGKGVKFEENLSWHEIKEKAKAENKYIFVDCYATWCGPCKAMDRIVYPNEEVGDFINNKFISVKVQMDTTKNDSEIVKKWHVDARALHLLYKIAGFPTFLFFSPDGKLVHKEMGYHDVDDFIEITKFAADSMRLEYYDQIEAYKLGNRRYSILPGLIKTTAEVIGDKELAHTIATDYKKGYLDRLSLDELCNESYLSFIREYHNLVTGSADKFFQLFYNNGTTVDSLLNSKGFSAKFVEFVIAKEEIWSKLYKDAKYTIPVTKFPDWKAIYSSISLKYSIDYAKALVPAAKIQFYRMTKNWKVYAALMDQNIKEDPPKQDAGLDGWPWKLNSAAWEVFLQCNDKEVLSRALEWSELSIKLSQPKPNIQYLDTRANLLYKLGRVGEAITQEQEAIEMDKVRARKMGRENGYFTIKYTAVVDKMMKGKPTWETQQ